MKPPVDSQAERARLESASLLGDSFGLSVLLLIGLTVAQRCIGLGRNVLFCGLLEDHELGRWSIVSNFLTWAAPFVVLGLPGSFGRLAEHYRLQGQLRTYLTRTSLVCGVLVAAATAFHWFFPGTVAEIVFNDPAQTATARLLGVVLVAVILMNFLTEFLTAVRLTRAVSLIHLVNSVAFTVLGVALLMGTSWPREQALVVAFGLSAGGASLIGFAFMKRLWDAPQPHSRVEESRQFWKRVTYFAAWVWCGNTITNLFDVCDQFLLKHFSHLPPAVIDGMVGQLFASRIIPGILVTIAIMVGSSLLPYLIADRESGRTDLVNRRINTVVKMTAIGFTLVAGLAQLASPVLFTWLLRGRYDSGLYLMPLAFAQYTWFGLVIIASKYLICIDRVRLATIPFLFGLVSCVTLIALLFPGWGLLGVIWATAAANAAALVTLLVLNARCGMLWERGTLLACVLPFSMCLGGATSLILTLGVIFLARKYEWLIHPEEKEQIADSIHDLGHRAWLAIRPSAQPFSLARKSNVAK